MSAGGGTVRLNSSGFEIDATTVGGEGPKQIKFLSSQDDVMGWMEVYQAGATEHYFEIGTAQYDGRDTNLSFYIAGDIKIATAGTDIHSVPWTNYYSSANVVGFSSMTASQVYYKKVGKLVFVSVNLSGVSNTNKIEFDVPFGFAAAAPNILCRVRNNSTFQTLPGWLQRVSGTRMKVHLNANSGNFATGGAKTVQVQFFYEAA